MEMNIDNYDVDDPNYRYIVWKGIICHVTKFPKEAVGGGLALHGINVEVI
jgi:hypothetical protein